MEEVFYRGEVKGAEVIMVVQRSIHGVLRTRRGCRGYEETNRTRIENKKREARILHKRLAVATRHDMH